jgi:hypothetical protein
MLYMDNQIPPLFGVIDQFQNVRQCVVRIPQRILAPWKIVILNVNDKKGRVYDCSSVILIVDNG